jgi:hypothetical protein
MKEWQLYLLELYDRLKIEYKGLLPYLYNILKHGYGMPVLGKASEVFLHQ